MQSSGIRRKALCIGIQYKGHKDVDDVIGAHADARRLATILKEKFGYEVEVFLDDGVGPCLPTKKNIHAAVKKLIKGARAEDRLFFHFSGHGTQVNNMDNTERDGLDEVILPVDCKVNKDYPEENNRNHWFKDSIILDDELNAWLLPNLPSGCRLTVLIDACHSGTALDLKYTFSCTPLHQTLPEQELECESPAKEYFSGSPLSPVTERSISAPPNLKERPQANTIPGHAGRMCFGDNGPCRSVTVRRVTDYPPQTHQDGPVVAYWAPCTDANKSYGSANGGLMVNAFVDILYDYDGPPTYRELLCSLHHRLRKKCREIKLRRPESLIEYQELQFGTNKPLVVDQPVLL